MTTPTHLHFLSTMCWPPSPRGDVATLLAHIADDVDFRIDHYDAADTSWQQARRRDLLVVLQRLAAGGFLKERRSCTHSTPLGSNWVLTQFHQRFFYAVQERTVET